VRPTTQTVRNDHVIDITWLLVAVTLAGAAHSITHQLLGAWLFLVINRHGTRWRGCPGGHARPAPVRAVLRTGAPAPSRSRGGPLGGGSVVHRYLLSSWNPLPQSARFY